MDTSSVIHAMPFTTVKVPVVGVHGDAAARSAWGVGVGLLPEQRAEPNLGVREDRDSTATRQPRAHLLLISTWPWHCLSTDASQRRLPPWESGLEGRGKSCSQWGTQGDLGK